MLTEQFNVTLDCGALYRCVKLRSRPRKLQPELETERLASMPAPIPVSQAAVIPRTPILPADDPYAEQRERMRQHKEAPAPAKPVKVFDVSEEDLDCTKSLRMMSAQPYFPGKATKVDINRPEGLDDLLNAFQDGPPVVVADMGAGAGQVAYK